MTPLDLAQKFLYEAEKPDYAAQGGVYSRDLKRWEWRNKESDLHREGGPALVYDDGTRVWFIHGEHHREGGPAIEYTNGDQKWLQHDKLHREDGPAVEYASGRKEWWLHGVRQPGPPPGRGAEVLR